MFPWQSGSDGREESQRLHLNPRSGHWNPDASARAHHIGIAVAYSAWKFYQVTGDLAYLIDYGAELLAEIARFFVSLATYDEERAALRHPRASSGPTSSTPAIPTPRTTASTTTRTPT